MNAPPNMMGSFDAPMTKVELHIACQHLKNLDALSKSDPMVVLFIMDNQNRWVEFGRTEMIKDNLNPKFVKTFQIDYRFEEVQFLLFKVVDVDNPHLAIEKQDFIGEMQCKLADIVTAREQKLTKNLHDPKHPSANRGQIVIQAEEIRELSYQVKLHFAGVRLEKKDLFGKSDPYLVIQKQSSSNQFVPVTKTEVIMKTLDPQWKPFTISMQQLCSGDYDKPLMIECFDWNRSGSHELIGTFKTNLRELMAGAKKEFDLVDPKKINKKGYKNSGVIRLIGCELIKSHTFLDYLAGGCEISLIVAIDFTASNGNPLHANSLHYMNPYSPNEYVKAIQAVGTILADYDYDKNFPVYGFGAKLPPSGAVSHCFPLNGNFQNPEVHGIEGILQAYQQTLSSVTLYGPTIFQQIIQISSQISSVFVSQEQQKYYVLLIITDGVINDMDNTIDEIIAATELPLSIVIVGVGDADFQNMEILDADTEPLRSARTGRTARRDIVQFVPMNKFKGMHPSLLAKEVLAEIPAQVLAFMKERNIVPKSPSSRPERPVNQSFYQPSPDPIPPQTYVSAPPTAPVAPVATAPAQTPPPQEGYYASMGLNPQSQPPTAPP